MTKNPRNPEPGARTRCAWCGAEIEPQSGPGRPRRYCRRSHRQRHHEARTLGARIGLGEDDILLSRAGFAELRDRIFILEAALEDASRDLAEDVEVEAILEDLRVAASDVAAARLEPRAVGP